MAAQTEKYYAKIDHLLNTPNKTGYLVTFDKALVNYPTVKYPTINYTTLEEVWNNTSNEKVRVI